MTSNSWEYSGDGHYLGYQAGAELMDIEFTQFHPTGMVWPPSVRGTLVTEGVRGDGGILKNSEGQRFMFNYIPERFAPETADTVEEANRWLQGDGEARRPPELLTRDVVARAILAEVKAGRGSPHGGVFLDIASRLPADKIKAKLPSMYHQFKELAELDITAEPMEVGPTLHYFMGGLRVDHDTQQTCVDGLFACGECAAGLHGANRLGGNSLSDLLVFGKLAGQGAGQYISRFKNTPQIEQNHLDNIIRNATDILNREAGENPYLLHEELQDIMQMNVGITRNQEDLITGIEKITELKKKVTNVKADGASQYNAGWHEAIDLDSLCLISEAVARGALMRQESRGAHTRDDYEGEREQWGQVNIIVKKGASEMELRQEKIAAPSDELKKIAHASIEDLEKGNV